MCVSGTVCKEAWRGTQWVTCAMGTVARRVCSWSPLVCWVHWQASSLGLRCCFCHLLAWPCSTAYLTRWGFRDFDEYCFCYLWGGKMEGAHLQRVFLGCGREPRRSCWGALVWQAAPEASSHCSLFPFSLRLGSLWREDVSKAWWKLNCKW